MRTHPRHQQLRVERRAHPETRAARSLPLTLAQRAARRTTRTEDHALYACGCGLAFAAGVSTSVACPRCGAGQAW